MTILPITETFIFRKICIKDRIKISERGEILKLESETAETLNIFFSNTVKNLNISRYSEFDPLTENIADTTFKYLYFQYRAIVKKKHFVSLRLTLKT